MTQHFETVRAAQARLGIALADENEKEIKAARHNLRMAENRAHEHDLMLHELASREQAKIEARDEEAMQAEHQSWIDTCREVDKDTEELLYAAKVVETVYNRMRTKLRRLPKCHNPTNPEPWKPTLDHPLAVLLEKAQLPRVQPGSLSLGVAQPTVQENMAYIADCICGLIERRKGDL